MNKKIIALAVAALASSASFAQSNVTIYGEANAGVEVTNVNGGGISKNRVESQTSYIGFKGAEDLGNGLKAIFQIESGVNLTGSANGTATTDSLATRNTYVGLSGNFGTVLMGRHDTPYKMSSQKLNLFKGTTSEYTAIVGEGSSQFDLRATNVIAYVSPNYNGFSGSLAHVANEGKTSSTNTPNAWSLALNYDQGPVFASYGYERHTDIAGQDTANANKVTLGYNINESSLVGVLYERIDAKTAGVEDKRDAWGLAAKYTMGRFAVKGKYVWAQDSKVGGVDQNDASKLYSLGVDYSLSKRTTAYAQYSKLVNDANGNRTFNINPLTVAAGQDAQVLGVGLKHSF